MPTEADSPPSNVKVTGKVLLGVSTVHTEKGMSLGGDSHPSGSIYLKFCFYPYIRNNLELNFG